MEEFLYQHVRDAVSLLLISSPILYRRLKGSLNTLFILFNMKSINDSPFFQNDIYKKKMSCCDHYYSVYDFYEAVSLFFLFLLSTSDLWFSPLSSLIKILSFVILDSCFFFLFLVSCYVKFYHGSSLNPRRKTCITNLKIY